MDFHHCKGNHKKRDCKQFGKSEGYQRLNSFVSSNQSAKKFPARSFDARDKRAAEKKVDVASYARGDDRATKTKYGLRENPKRSEKSVSFKEQEIRKSNSASGKVKKVAQSPTTSLPDGCSGMATLEGTLDVPYQLDSGADHSVIYEWMVEILHERAFIGITKLEEPFQVVLGTGQSKQSPT